MILPRGITGFGNINTDPPLFLDEKAFCRMCHALAQENGGAVTEVDTDTAARNFYSAKLSRYGELAVYSFLKRCENRKTHQCWPSIKTIGQAVGMSVNTVRKYLRRLEERELVTTEPTEVITRASGRRNGNLLFTLRPIGEVIDQHYDRQLAELELAAERQRVANLLREQESPA